MEKNEEIARLRCMNKPVKYISKKLGLSRDYIEKVIRENIEATDPFIENLIKGRKIKKFDSGAMFHIKDLDFSAEGAEKILNDDDALDYIALKMKDHHDRMMDCLRYLIILYIKDKK